MGRPADVQIVETVRAVECGKPRELLEGQRLELDACRSGDLERADATRHQGLAEIGKDALPAFQPQEAGPLCQAHERVIQRDTERLPAGSERRTIELITGRLFFPQVSGKIRAVELQ